MQSVQKKEVHTISLAELAQFTEFMSERYGLQLSWYNQDSLSRRLSRVLANARLDNLQHLMLLLSRNSDYFHRFINSFTVKVTELFREPLALKELRTLSFPHLQRIISPKILIVGSSSGEEMISLCIMLEEVGLLEQSEIMVTDISKDALAKSQNFAVSKTKIKHASMNYHKAGGNALLEDYYQSTSSMCFFKESLFQNVKWSLFDITQSELGMQFDLILCKNVLIYFNHEFQSKPLTRLVRHLRPGGVLALGEQESMAFYKNDSFQMQTLSSEFKIYRKSLKQL